VNSTTTTLALQLDNAPILVAVDQETANWRAETLERAGYEDDQVKLLALDGAIDLHLAVALIARGCTHALALRILL
jgi:hypothetical protein